MTDKKGYQPNYAQREILVVFKGFPDMNDNFAKIFGQIIGYELLGTYEHSESDYIFQTPVGQEDKACKEFASHEKFIDCASRRDLKLDKRWNELEEAERKIQDLHENADLPDDEYNKQLQKIIEYLQSLQ